LNNSNFVLEGGTISGNTARSGGGGIYVIYADPFVSNGGTSKTKIEGNSPDNVFERRQTE